MSVLVAASVCFPFTYYQSCFACRFHCLHVSFSLSITQYQRCHTKVDFNSNFRFNIDVRHQTQLHVSFWTWLPSVSKDTNRREQTITNRCVVYRMLVYNSQTGGERGKDGGIDWLASARALYCEGKRNVRMIERESNNQWKIDRQTSL